jgi:hypothetical protein
LEREHGSGPVHLKAVASIGVGRGRHRPGTAKLTEA